LGDGANVAIAGFGADTVTGGLGADVVLGDSGSAAFEDDGAGGVRLTTAESTALDQGGADIIGLGDGANVVIAGFGADTVTGGAEHDLLVGDNGRVTFVSGLLTSIASTDADETTGGNDALDAGEGVNQLIGGAGADTLTAGAGDDHALGDHGAIAYDAGALRSVTSEFTGIGGDDIIELGDGANVAIAGFGADVIATGAGDDLLVGDNGRILVLGAESLFETTDIAVATGGADVIVAGGGDDVVFGGVGDDHVDAGAGDDVVFGDNGWLRRCADETVLWTDLDDVAGGADRLAGGAGDDILLGGMDGDALRGGGGDDLMFGDAAEVVIRGESIVAETIGLERVGGDDQLDGGAGRDRQYGGYGAIALAGDEFVSQLGMDSSLPGYVRVVLSGGTLVSIESPVLTQASLSHVATSAANDAESPADGGYALGPGAGPFEPGAGAARGATGQPGAEDRRSSSDDETGLRGWGNAHHVLSGNRGAPDAGQATGAGTESPPNPTGDSPAPADGDQGTGGLLEQRLDDGAAAGQQDDGGAAPAGDGGAGPSGQPPATEGGEGGNAGQNLEPDEDALLDADPELLAMGALASAQGWRVLSTGAKQAEPAPKLDRGAFAPLAERYSDRRFLRWQDGRLARR